VLGTILFESKRVLLLDSAFSKNKTEAHSEKLTVITTALTFPASMEFYPIFQLEFEL
jgi:hypothetical protein